jgi:demethylmenaquinone methyltransferase/2-methoxy-6-polyprenyl-1,4-benzoquinol methylase
MKEPVPVSPHPPLADWYGNEREHRPFLNRLFDESAPFYNAINNLASMGSGQWYRKWSLGRAGLLPGMKVLDVATGTGAVARPAGILVGPSGMVAGLDPSLGMMAQQRGKRYSTRLTQGVADRLPFRDASFDFISMGYALRHVRDLGQTFYEYLRVLKPGGTLLVLDFCRPESRVARLLSRFYLQTVVPRLVRLTAGGRTAQRLMEYCWQTVDQCVSPERILEQLRSAGFTEIGTARHAMMIDYRARRPAKL